MSNEQLAIEIIKGTIYIYTENTKYLDIQLKIKQNMCNICRRLSLVTQSCPTFCDPMDCSTSGFPVHHQLPEPIQTHVHCIGDAIQLFHPLSSPSPPAFILSQQEGLLQ